MSQQHKLEWVGAGVGALLMLIYLLSGGGGDACEREGSWQGLTVRSDPQRCREVARYLGVSESEMVRRDRIIRDRDACEASVRTPQGRDICAVKYPFNW
jgi:hypothetical protein